MASWSRLNQSKLKALVSIQSRVRHFGSRGGCSLIYASKTSGRSLVENPIGNFIKKPAAFSGDVRFFAASVQAKLEVDANNGPILNDRIKFPYVRLVTDEGHTIVSACEALEQAKRLNLDLVLVQRDADPPVCKIFNYNRERFKQRVKEKERNKSKITLRKGECKEVRFSAKTEQKDLKMKADTIKRLMEDGYRVKCVALPSKNQRRVSGHGEDEEGKDLKALFTSLINMIEDEAIIECKPIVKNGQAHIIVRHVKFGIPGKGAKKSKDVEDATSEDGTFSNEDDQRGGISEDDQRGRQFQPIQPEPSHVAENRYRVEPRNNFSPAGSTVTKGTVNGESPGLHPQFPIQREQQPPDRHQWMDSSACGDFNQPPPNRTYGQEPYVPPPPRARVHQPPPNGTFNQEPLPPFPPRGSSTPTPSYGIFRPPSTSVPGGQGVAAESNRYARKPNAPSSKTDGQRAGRDHGGPSAFGRFRRDGASFDQSNMPKAG